MQWRLRGHVCTYSFWKRRNGKAREKPKTRRFSLEKTHIFFLPKRDCGGELDGRVGGILNEICVQVFVCACVVNTIPISLSRGVCDL